MEMKLVTAFHFNMPIYLHTHTAYFFQHQFRFSTKRAFDIFFLMRLNYTILFSILAAHTEKTLHASIEGSPTRTLFFRYIQKDNIVAVGYKIA